MKILTKTISRVVKLEGIGLHSGKPVCLSLAPAPGKGILFVRSDIEGFEPIPLSIDTYHFGNRCSQVDSPKGSIYTLEHLLAVFYVLNLDDILVEVDSPELPAGDGSAALFLKLVDSAEVVQTGEEVECIELERTISISEGSWSLELNPSDALVINYFLDLNAFDLPDQEIETTVTERSFREIISKARTFVPAQEAQKLRELGFGLGANHSNTLLLGDDKAEERMQNEAGYHKILDIIGDLACLRRPLRAKISAERTGHKQNNTLAKVIHKLRSEDDATL